MSGEGAIKIERGGGGKLYRNNFGYIVNEEKLKRRLRIKWRNIGSSIRVHIPTHFRTIIGRF